MRRDSCPFLGTFMGNGRCRAIESRDAPSLMPMYIPILWKNDLR